MGSEVELVHLPLHLASGPGTGHGRCCPCWHRAWAGPDGGDAQLHVVTQGPGASHASDPPSSRSSSSLLSAGRWRKSKLRELRKRFLWILSDSDVRQTTLNGGVSNNEHLLFFTVLWTCWVVNWVWADLAGPRSLRPHPRPHPQKAWARSRGSKGFPAPGDGTPNAQASFCFRHIYCCALAKTSHMAKPGAGEESTQDEEAETPSANDRLPRPKPGGIVRPWLRGVDRGRASAVYRGVGCGLLCAHERMDDDAVSTAGGDSDQLFPAVPPTVGCEVTVQPQAPLGFRNFTSDCLWFSATSTANTCLFPER